MRATRTCMQIKELRTRSVTCSCSSRCLDLNFSVNCFLLNKYIVVTQNRNDFEINKSMHNRDEDTPCNGNYRVQRYRDRSVQYQHREREEQQEQNDCNPPGLYPASTTQLQVRICSANIMCINCFDCCTCNIILFFGRWFYNTTEMSYASRIFNASFTNCDIHE